MTLSPTVKDLLAARNAIHKRLAASEDYQAIKAIEATIERLCPGALAVTDDERPSPASHAPPVNPRRRVSQIDAVDLVLKRLGVPRSTDELIPDVEAEGAHMSGDKKTNLSSALSRNGMFESVHWGGARRWWYSARELPPEPGSVSLKENADDAGCNGVSANGFGAGLSHQ